MTDGQIIARAGSDLRSDALQFAGHGADEHQFTAVQPSQLGGVWHW